MLHTLYYTPAMASRPSAECTRLRCTGADKEITPASPELQPVSYNYSFFHVIFALASMYIAMLMTGWGTGAEERDLIDVGWTSVWVKTASMWVTALLYMWTLVAPALFPDREF